MVRPRRVVPQGHGGVGADEDRSRVAHPRRQRLGVRGDDQQMLRREVVDDAHRFVHVARHDDAAVGLADDLGALEPAQQVLQLFDGASREPLRVGDQDTPRHRVVLQLRREVGGDEVRAGVLVGQDHDLGRARDAVDADRAEDLSLRQRHVDVAGPGDDVDPRDALGAIGEGRDRLRAADPIYGIDAGDARRREDRRGHAAVAPGRRREDDLRHARDTRRDRRHQHGRGVGRAPTGRVHPGASDRPGDQAHARRTGRCGLRELPLVEVADPCRRELERRPVGGLQAGRRRLELLAPDLKPLVLGRGPAVEPQAELAEGGVALVSNPGAYLGDRCALGAEACQVEPAARQRRLPPGRGVKAPNRHRPSPPSASTRPTAPIRSVS